MKKYSLLIFFIYLLSYNTTAQNTQKARLINQIANNIIWNPNKIGNKFTVAVLSDKAIFEALKKELAGKTIAGKPVLVKRFRFKLQIKPVNLFFIDGNNSENIFFEEVINKMQGKSTLLVTEKRNMINHGSHINILNQSGRLVYQMSGQAIKNVGLSYNETLKQQAISNNTVVNKEKKSIKDVIKKKKNKNKKEEDNNPEGRQKDGLLNKIAQEKQVYENRILILNKYISSLEEELNKNNIDYKSLKSEFEKEKAIAEKEISDLNLVIIEKDSLIKKEQEIISLTKAKKKEAEKAASLNFKVAILGISLAIIFLIAGAWIFRERQVIKKQKNKLAENIEEIKQQSEEIASQRDEIEKQKNLIQIEQEQSENLLLNILPPETAQELKERGKATPREYDLATVMFTDFKGFTRVAEQLTPEEIIEELNYCFSKFDEIVEKHGLERIKTIGDSYMCVGGLRPINKTNPEDAVKAAIEMQNFMREWKANRKANNLPYFECRLGLHSGKVIAGVIGKKKFAYDIWGDTVNLASRMESSGEVDKINISETTYKLIKDKFEFEHRGEISAKGKGKVNMYFVKN